MRARRLLKCSVAGVVALAAVWWMKQTPPVAAQGPVRFAGPTNSQPIALSADGWLLAVANPDNNSVSIFDTRQGANTRVAQVGVGVEPNGVAVSPDGSRVYVANTVSGTVSVLSADRAATAYGGPVATIPVGTEPYALALTPSGKKLYVANARSNSVSVIDTATNRVTKTITDVGPEPRGIAITNSGATSDDAQETVFVTQFLALPVAGKLDGFDDAKSGRVTVISAATDTVTGTVTLNPIADSGFKSAGDALGKQAPPAAPVEADFKFTTGAYPNQLNNLAIRGHFAFVPNTGASPNGPTRFDVNTQSLLSVFDTATRADAGKTINMHRAVAAQTPTPKRFITQPWAMAFKHTADEGYVISAASNILVKVRIDPGTGTPTVVTDAADGNRVFQLATGKNPRGIVVSDNDQTAYIMNYVSRDVTVVSLTGTERVTATLASANQPTAGSPEDTVHIGKELYHTSVGEFDPAAAGGAPITGRMSNNGWGSCASCHPFGLTDNVVWIFGAGPRRTIPQHVDFVQNDPSSLRALNWSAIFDEEEDFEANIRGVSGGQGLLVQADGVTQDPALGGFTPASGGRRQLKVRGVNAWDALKAFMVSGIRAPISPADKADPDVVAGRALFTESNCQSCHGGAQWSTGKVRATPPPDTSMLLNGAQLIGELRNVGTFTATAANEVRANATAPLGAAGFNPAPLLSLFAFPQTFFHNGSADTLDAVMANVAHRSAGTGTDRLTAAPQRAQLIKFLLSIDAKTVVINPAAPGALRNVNAAGGGATLAPDSFVSALGTALSTATATGGDPYPNVLAGSTVSIRDAAGVLRLGVMSYAGPGQINFVMPPATAVGQATVTTTSGNGTVSTGTVAIARVAPGLFAINGGGTGVAAATAIRVNADGSQSAVTVFNCPSSGGCTAAPIDLSAGDVYLTLYGTGIRNRTALTAVRCTIGGADTPVLFAGAQGTFPALDQVNVQVPGSLRGRGTVNIVLTVDGQTSNEVTIGVQ